MPELIAGSTGLARFDPNVPLDSLAIEVATASGTPVAFGDPVKTAATDTTPEFWTSQVSASELTDALLFTRLAGFWTLVKDGQSRRVPVVFWVLDDEYPGYGDVEGVSKLLAVTRLTATSTPSVRDVMDESLVQRRQIDARLSSSSIAVPITGEAKLLVGDAENLIVAASWMERLMIARDPGGSWVSTVKAWRGQADSLIASICKGSTRLSSAPKTDANAGVANATDLSPDSDLATFSDAYGGQSPFGLIHS